jgi:hypothetical protein
VIGVDYGRDRLFYTDNETIREWMRRVTFKPGVLLRVREQSNLRDIRPNTGFRLLSRATLDVWADAQAERSWETQVEQLLSVSGGRHGSAGVVAGLLWQNTGGVTNLDTFLPRGLDDRALGDGVFVKYAVNYLFPLAFIDDGLVILPIFLRSLYLYGFAETVVPAEAVRFRIDSVGLSVGLQARIFYAFDFDIRIGAAWLPAESEFRAVYR